MTTTTPGRVLTVRDLRLDAESGIPLLKGVSFSIRDGERVGLIGESGSGKSLTALSIMGLLPEGVRTRGSITLSSDGNSREIVGGKERELSRIRGNDIAMVFQEPMTALNPTMRVGEQVAETMLAHRTRPDRRSAAAAAIGLLEAVGIPEPAQAMRAFPHNFSGGQQQRIVLAIALANDPALLVCDEPTTALDVTVQARVLDLILSGVAERRAAMLFVTHDLAVVARACERILVMYAGRVVESGSVEDVLLRPHHPYTQALVGASDLRNTDERGRLITISGSAAAAKGFGTSASDPEWIPLGDEAGYASFDPATAALPNEAR